jgi:hypothetical protein
MVADLEKRYNFHILLVFLILLGPFDLIDSCMESVHLSVQRVDTNIMSFLLMIFLIIHRFISCTLFEVVFHLLNFY